MKRAPKFSGRLTILENSDPISAETEEIQSRVRARAYELSLLRGHGGREVDDWISAESEIISVPPAEMIEKGEAFEVRFAVGGINPADLNVMATTQELLLKCDYRHQHDPLAGTIHFCDFKSATVFRSVQFPQAIDVTRIDIQFEDAIVRIHAPKQGAGAAPAKRAPVRKAAAKKRKKATRSRV